MIGVQRVTAIRKFCSRRIWEIEETLSVVKLQVKGRAGFSVLAPRAKIIMAAFCLTNPN